MLEEIKNEPSKYLGRTSVVALKGFINGYHLARRESNLPLTKQEQDFQKFQDWINPPDTPLFSRKEDSWDKLLILYAHDETKAFLAFFQKLEKFKNRDRLKKEDADTYINEESKIEYLKRRKSLNKHS